MADDVQPQEGQGDETTGIFDPYIQAVPEEHREAVAGYLKDAEKNVNGRLQEAADLEKRFGSFKDIDLTAYDPEGLSQLIAWHQQISQDENTFKEWVAATAQEMGLTPKEEDELAEQVEDGELTREQIQQMIQDAASERMNPVQEQLTNIEQEKAIDLEEHAIGKAFEELQKEHSLDLSKEQRETILRLGADYAYNEKGEDLPMGDASWVKQGFEDLQKLLAGAQRDFINEKSGAPQGALSAGGVPQSKPITSFEDANAAMRERLRQQT
jgi:hypothetical protein